MPIATGPSQAATGTVTADTASTLTLARPTSMVLITNYGQNAAFFSLNRSASETDFDFLLAGQSSVWISQVKVTTIGVYSPHDDIAVRFW